MNKKCENSISMLLTQLSHGSMKEMNILLNQGNIKKDQEGVLFILMKYGSMSQKEISKKMCVTPPSITATLQKMEKKSLVQRIPDEKDKRVLRICITPEGKKIMDDIHEKFIQFEERLLSDFSKEEKEQLSSFLMRMRDNVTVPEEEV